MMQRAAKAGHLTATRNLGKLHTFMEAGVQAAAMIAEAIRRGRVVEIKPEADKVACRFSDGGRVLVSTFLAGHICPGDEIDFPLAIDSACARTELYIRKPSSSGRSRDLYQAPICYAAQPKADQRDRLYVRAEVSAGRLGICFTHLPCEVLRDYFYVANRHRPWECQPTLYEILRVTPAVSLAELRLAFKLRQFELRDAGAPRSEHGAVERAFNILAQPEL